MKKLKPFDFIFFCFERKCCEKGYFLLLWNPEIKRFTRFSIYKIFLRQESPSFPKTLAQYWRLSSQESIHFRLKNPFASGGSQLEDIREYNLSARLFASTSSSLSLGPGLPWIYTSSHTGLNHSPKSCWLADSALSFLMPSISSPVLRFCHVCQLMFFFCKF